MLYSSLDFVHIFIAYFLVTFNLLSYVRVNQIVNFFLEVELFLGDEAHIEHPLFVVLIFHADFGELRLIKTFILVEVKLCKFTFIRTF